MNHLPVVSEEQRASYNGPTTNVEPVAASAPKVEPSAKPVAKKAAAPKKPARKTPAKK